MSFGAKDLNLKVAHESVSVPAVAEIGEHRGWPPWQAALGPDPELSNHVRQIPWNWRQLEEPDNFKEAHFAVTEAMLLSSAP